MLENTKKYYCESCDFKCSKKSNWDLHLFTIKHKNIVEGYNEDTQKMPESKLYTCICGNAYKHHSGLWRHKLQCINRNGNANIDNNYQLLKTPILENENLALLLIETVKQNQELQKQSQDFQQKMFEMMSDKIGTQNTMINSNNNTTNNKFNLNFFLNETCKDAMNINEFIDSIKVSFEDVEYSGMHGFT